MKIIVKKAIEPNFAFSIAEYKISKYRPVCVCQQSYEENNKISCL